MEQTNSERYRNKKTKSAKSVNERIANIYLQNNVHKESFMKINSTGTTKNHTVEDYPKLRRPKPATLLKIQTHQKKTEEFSKETKGGKSLLVTSRQEFVNIRDKKQQLNNYSSKTYDQHETLLGVHSDETPQPITLQTKLDLQLNEQLEIISEPPKSSARNCTIAKSLNYCEQHVVNILHIKVKAHPNGFFAEDLPLWYKNTFRKDLPSDWLELLEASKQFDIENVQNKTLLYTKETREYKNIDLKAYGDANPEYAEKELDKSVTFVRYKHLQKSLREYNKDTGRLYRNADKHQ